jgi:hypothetical protein
MTDSVRTPGELVFETAFPSDSLAKFVELLRSISALAALTREFIQVRVVIDANVVHGEIHWHSKRRNPNACSALQEVIDSVLVQTRLGQAMMSNEPVQPHRECI